ncbi:VQ motif-containing protein 22-like [Lolium rigidum]|uniref:VQ motif-containing protein 22-like n=1 Tax=Lolium rigidum TaxID=89674 RepID=UPI001F5E0416|nr:VQ motif-containing protein 22-like [Lolium rigidum]
MGETSANMAHWTGLYGAGAGGNGGPATGEGSGVTVSSPTSGGSGGSPARSAPGVEAGRVGKPARRRSRASRRAPVTLLNTDTSNFRAMVQQFTGIPSGPYGPGGVGGPVISFGAGGSGVGMPVRPSPTSAVMSFDHLGGQYQPHRPVPTSSLQQQQQSQLFRPQQHQQQQQYGGDYGSLLGGGGGDMSFLHGFESSAEDRLLLQSIQAAGSQMMPRPASTNNTNGYNFG